MPYKVMQHSTVQFSNMQYGTVYFSAVQRYGGTYDITALDLSSANMLPPSGKMRVMSMSVLQSG